MLYVRPDAGLKAQECNLRVSIQPLRLNVDQVMPLFNLFCHTHQEGIELMTFAHHLNAYVELLLARP